MHERASARLVGITADHLSRHVNRGAVDAKVVLAIDAVGPRTAATAIVSADGQLLHCEDLPCQLSASQRGQAVNKMGELIHAYHVDLIVISNGPARRATMIALNDLISQSPPDTVRWTLADRSGADAYASSGVANDEMRSTPRRFRAAAWLAFSVLQPAQALAKVDPLKLRLSSFQRELSDDALADALTDVMTSGASRGGVDANSAPVSWLQKLPGISAEMATTIDKSRREQLFNSRQALLDLEQWESSANSRQAIPFLRVFNAEEPLDGTLIHPEDYPLAKKLAATLEIELPPAAPPSYEAPDYSQLTEPVDPTKLAERQTTPQPAPVEDFSAAGENAAEFAIDAEVPAAEVPAAVETAADASEAQDASASPDATAPTDGGTPSSEPTAETPDAGEETAAEDTNTAAGDTGEAVTDQAAATETEPAAETEQNDTSTTESASTESSSVTPPEIPDRVLRAKPDRSKTDKCIKEWQIGARRTQQLVQWLCDPFGDSDASGNAPAVMNTMPSLRGLKPGDQAIGIVVGIMPFGVFVELAPDCSGLIHVSRVSDSYVEDLHEAVQVGDIVTAWVSGIDEKRRRVALSALSPEREAELEQARQAHHSRGGGQRRDGGGRGRSGGQAQGGGQARGGQARGGGGGQQGSNRSESGNRGGGQARGGQARGGGQSRGGGQARGGGQPRGRGRDAGRGGKRREKRPESYRVVGKKESKPISDAMQKGEEPLRSFGDLMQFFDHSAPTEKPKASAPKPAKPKSETPPEAAPPTAEAETKDSGTPASDNTQAANSDASSMPTPSAPSEAPSSPAETDNAGKSADANQSAEQKNDANPPPANDGGNPSPDVSS
ncbi:MAG: S1 RNA-binding domain-containing protein [Rubripirellula sp.]|nr:S1 RNA-binding domain-containing protein [Rubripirellula sp.]